MTDQQNQNDEPTYGTPEYLAWASARYQRHLDAQPNEFWVSDGGWDEKAKRCTDPIYYGVPCLPGLSVHVISVPSNVWQVKDWLESQPRAELDAAVNAKREAARAEVTK